MRTPVVCQLLTDLFESGKFHHGERFELDRSLDVLLSRKRLPCMSD
jgi:hypothetical protein